MVPMWMYPISIACGNSFILKPSEKDPSCSLKLAELFSEAGLPDGVFNVINGDKDVVNRIYNLIKFLLLVLLGLHLLQNIFIKNLLSMERGSRHLEVLKTI